MPKESLNVDRWSVITSFWQNYFKGEYVYFAKSFANNYPGPMPFYFILALPFYLLGELGLLSLSGIIVFCLFVNRYYRLSNTTPIPFILIATSLVYSWEIYSRSNIFINGSLILISIVYFFDKYKKTIKSNLIFGIIIGLLLSTRNVFIIPYIITFLTALRIKKIDLINVFYLGTIAIGVFIVTFLPFVINHFEDFKLMNPFVIQSTFLMPFKYNLIFILVAISLSFLCKKESDVYFYSGLNLFLTIFFYISFTIFNYNFDAAFYGNIADISYFILCLPFFIYHLFLDKKMKFYVK